MSIGLVPVKICILILSRDLARPRDWRIVWRYGPDLFVLSYHTAKLVGHRYCGIRNKMSLVFHVISQDHMTRLMTRQIYDQQPRLVSHHPVVTINTVVVEFKYFCTVTWSCKTTWLKMQVTLQVGVLERSYEMITVNYFCVCHKNRRKYNQYFKLLFFKLNLHFVISNQISPYRKLNLLLINSVYLVFYT